MKDYDHVVVWLDYFNKNLPRSRGRRMPRGRCVFDPTFKELVEGAAEAGLEVAEQSEGARFPKRPYVRSGYIVLPKAGPKHAHVSRIADAMAARRARRSRKKKKN